MAEVKQIRPQRRTAPTVDRWLIDLESDDSAEPEFDPYGGRFSSDQTEFESEDSDFDGFGGHGLFSF